MANGYHVESTGRDNSSIECINKDLEVSIGLSEYLN